MHVHALCTHILEVFWGAPSQLTLSYTFNTEDGSVNAVPQILYGQYLSPISYYGSIWEFYVLDLKTKFFVEREPATFFQGQGLTVPK